MSISLFSYDYTERKRDISIFQNPDFMSSDRQQVALKFGKSAKFCAGVQKLIQQYTIILMTDLGSQPSFLDFGTSLVLTLKRGISPVDKIALTQLFGLANYSVVTKLKNYYAENTDIPEDEQISSAILNDVSVRGSSVFFEIMLTTVAGEQLEFLIPLPE